MISCHVDLVKQDFEHVEIERTLLMTVSHHMATSTCLVYQMDTIQ